MLVKQMRKIIQEGYMTCLLYRHWILPHEYIGTAQNVRAKESKNFCITTIVLKEESFMDWYQNGNSVAFVSGWTSFSLVVILL